MSIDYLIFMIDTIDHWSKLIVPPAIAQGAQVDPTCPWLVIAGDPGCPGIARHFLAQAEQNKMADTSGKFAPRLMIFFSAPGYVNGTSQVYPTERQSSWPAMHLGRDELIINS